MPTSLVSVLGNSDGSFDSTRNGDGDSRLLAMEYMLSLSDEQKCNLVEAFTVVPMRERKTVRLLYYINP